MKQCPDCAEMIQVEAGVCRHCGRGKAQPDGPLLLHSPRQGMSGLEVLGLLFLVFFVLWMFGVVRL